MKVLAKQKCMHFPKTRQCPASPILEQYDASHRKFTHLQRHQEALALYVGKAEVDTSGEPVGITIPNDMLHPLVDSVDEPLRKLGDPGMVSLRRVSKTQGMHNEEIKRMSLSTPARKSLRGRLRGLGKPSPPYAARCPAKLGVQFHIIASQDNALTSISCLAILAASPIPTASAAGKVPLRNPLSCPPPLRMGSNRTRGRLLT